MSTRQNWSECRLRVFAIANKRTELELEHRNMASLLSKFRIDFSDLTILPDITKKPTDETKKLFQSLIQDFLEKPECKYMEKQSSSESEGNFCLDYFMSNQIDLFLKKIVF